MNEEKTNQKEDKNDNHATTNQEPGGDHSRGDGGDPGHASTQEGGVPAKTLALVHQRVSQINGCSACVDGGARQAKKAGETDDRLFAVAAWREAPYFTDAERAALALAEAATRLSDRSDPVSDEIWNNAARHFNEPALAALILSIATTNFYNRLNVMTKQVAGENQWSKR